MSSVPIEQLFETRRVSSIASLLFYSPVGIVLFSLRLIVGLQAFIFTCLLPKGKLRSTILRFHCQFLGVSVDVDGEKHQTSKAKVLVTNHISKLDHLTVSLVCPCVIPGVWDLPTCLEWALGIKDLGVKQGRDVLIKNAKYHCQSSRYPILTHPEGATTNGKVGLLKFSTWPFSLDQPVQPISIRRVGNSDVALTAIGSRWWTDLLWMFFLPSTKFKIKILPVMEKEDLEGPEDFSKRVQRIIAEDLNLRPTSYTCSDKLEYVKKVLFKSQNHPRRPHADSIRNVDVIDSMAVRVKDVLPAVPLNVIKKDLAKTNSVDTTIMHLLEGTISYTPQVVTTTATTSTDATQRQDSSNVESTPRKSPPLANTAAKTFEKNPHARILSLKERKKQLIETARRRYIDKHGLDTE